MAPAVLVNGYGAALPARRGSLHDDRREDGYKPLINDPSDDDVEIKEEPKTCHLDI